MSLLIEEERKKRIERMVEGEFYRNSSIMKQLRPKPSEEERIRMFVRKGEMLIPVLFVLLNIASMLPYMGIDFGVMWNKIVEYAQLPPTEILRRNPILYHASFLSFFVLNTLYMVYHIALRYIQKTEIPRLNTSVEALFLMSVILAGMFASIIHKNPAIIVFTVMYLMLAPFAFNNEVLNFVERVSRKMKRVE